MTYHRAPFSRPNQSFIDHADPADWMVGRYDMPLDVAKQLITEEYTKATRVYPEGHRARERLYRTVMRVLERVKDLGYQRRPTDAPSR